MSQNPTPASSGISLADMSDRQQAMHRAYQHYIGKPPAPLRARGGEPDDNLIISLGRLIVDKGTSFLFGQPVQDQVTDGQPEPKQDWLDECWRQNKRAITLCKFATNGGIYGHAFWRLLDTKPCPRIVVLDSQTLDVLTDPDDIDNVWRFTITPPPQQREEGEPPVRTRTMIANPSGQAGYRINVAEQWTIYDQVLQGGAWVTTATQQWPYPFCPIVHCQNLPKANDFWGESDLPDDIQKILAGINRVASHYNKIIRLHAHPKVWSRGMGTRTIDVAIDTVINLPSETAELQALEMKSDLGSTMALLEKLLNLLSMMTRIPLVAMGMPDNLGAISGVALQIRYQPLIEKTTMKRETYGEALIETDRRFLAMGGFGDTTIPTLHWREMLPADHLMERQVAVIDDSLAIVSRETLAEKFGYDWDEEQKRRQDEIAQERAQNVAQGLNPDGSVPAPAPIVAQKPDQAMRGKSS